MLDRNKNCCTKDKENKLMLNEIIKKGTWVVNKNVAKQEHLFLDGRRMLVVNGPFRLLRAVFFKDGSVVSSAVWINTQWEGQLPLWSELFPVKYLLLDKLKEDAWEIAPRHAMTQVIGDKQIVLGPEGLKICYNCQWYSINEHLPEGLVQWLLET